jgi:hypothetical protein
MHTNFITFATKNFEKNAKILTQNALNVGFSSATVVTPDDFFDSDFYRRNIEILQHKRGAGYWLWKPYLILEKLKQASIDEVLFYCDAGRSGYYTFSRFPENLINVVKKNASGFLLGPPQTHLGQVRHWTKRDCLILLNSDKEQYLEKGQLVTWSLWRPTQNAFEFLETWLYHCEDARCLTDQPNVCGMPNHTGFIEHRHDMAILTLLAYTNHAPHLDFTKSRTHRFLELRPQSELAQNFYKRPENSDNLLKFDNPFMLVNEFLRLKRART